MNCELYKSIAQRAPEGCHLLATVIDGMYAGEKLFLSDGKIVWQCSRGAGSAQQETDSRDTDCADRRKTDDNSMFLPRFMDEIGKIQHTCMMELEGARVFCERIGNVPTMVVCGAGHVSVPVIQIGKNVGFRVLVLEDRPKFADDARRAGADVVYCDTFEQGMENIPGSADTYFVIVTRGHRYDACCLRAAIGKPNAYIGMMGSRKRVALLKSRLMEEGMKEEQLAKLHAPIGLTIGAETPEEIAVSIIAELIQTKNSHRRTTGYDETVMRYLTGEMDVQQEKVLATIVSRQGSAPREIGTKMLITEEGRTVGTIGGGCMESEVIRQALSLMRGQTQCLRMIKADMTGAEAHESGMVCGGVIEVLLEQL